jgi:hypothetical protein
MNEVRVEKNNRMDRGHNKTQGGRRSGEIDNKIIKGIQEYTYLEYNKAIVTYKEKG